MIVSLWPAVKVAETKANPENSSSTSLRTSLFKSVSAILTVGFVIDEYLYLSVVCCAMNLEKFPVKMNIKKNTLIHTTGIVHSENKQQKQVTSKNSIYLEK